MTYSAGNIILATDYNGFASTNGANVNGIWGTGAANLGYGQSTTLTTVSAGGTVTATQWASLNSRITSMAAHQGTTITSRTNPVAGNTIAILANLSADITAITTAAGNAATQGSQFTGWTGNASYTSNIAVTGDGWDLIFRSDIAYANADAARYFFNGGGTVKWQVGKTSTGQPADDDWNNLAGNLCGAIYITNGGYTQGIGGTDYTGTTKVGGTGTPTVLTTGTGFRQFTTDPTIVYKQYDSTYGYTNNYIQVQANVDSNSSPTTLTLTTTWHGDQLDPYHPTANITGGTATTGITFGSAPATVVTYYPPETTNLTNTWGTPSVTSTTAFSNLTPYSVQYLVVGGGGGGGSSGSSTYGGGGGGSGAALTGTFTATTGYTYTVVVGAGGAGASGGGNANLASNGGNSSVSNADLTTILCRGGGGGGNGNAGANTAGQSGGSGGGAGSPLLNVGGATVNGGGAQQIGGFSGGPGSTIFRQYSGTFTASGGGGGAGGAGARGGSAVTFTVPTGGVGIANPITGSTVGANISGTYYVAGGGGGVYNNGSQFGAGGNGGGGNGASSTASANAVVNTGGGGGGVTGAGIAGGNGGSGVVVFNVPTTNYSGTYSGNVSVSTSGGNTLITFLSGNCSYTA